MGSVMNAISSPSPSAHTVPSPLFSSRARLNPPVTPLKDTFQVAFCRKKKKKKKQPLKPGLGAVEPSDRGPAVPFLDERKRGGRGTAGKGFKCFPKLERGESADQIYWTEKKCKYNKITQTGEIYSHASALHLAALTCVFRHKIISLLTQYDNLS